MDPGQRVDVRESAEDGAARGGPLRASPDARRPHFPQLDGLRAFAVFAVMFAHFGGPISARLGAYGLDTGALGVRCFYVLSGFLITTLLLGEATGDFARRDVLKRFYIRRVLRIFPLYYLVVLIGLLAGVADIRDNLLWHVTYLSDWSGRAMGTASHFWSLCVEEQFYLVWPLALILLGRHRLWTAVVLGTAVVVSFATGLLVSNAIDARTAGSFAFLGLGCALSLGWRGVAPIAKILLGSGGGILVVAVLHALIAQGRDSLSPGALAYYWQAALCAWLVWKAVKGFDGVAGKVMSLHFVRYIGKISYGIYVFHLFVPTALRRLGGTTIAELNPYLRAALYTGVTVLLAALSWQLFERRICELKKRFEAPAQTPAGSNSEASTLEATG